MTANFLNFYLKFITVSQIPFCESLDSDKQSSYSITRFVGKI